MTPILECQDVSRVYHSGESEVYALDHVSYQFAASDMTAVIGPSGSGKTTLLNVLGGLDGPNEGKVLYNGEDILAYKEKKLAEYRRSKVGFVFQNYSLLEGIDVLENILLPQMLDKRKPDKKRAEELLESVHLGNKQHAAVHELSGGQKQRVAIVRALMNTPSVLLCDEPTGNLDMETGMEIMELLSELNQQQKISIIMVTHNMDLAQMCRNIIRIEDGKVHTYS